MLPDIPSILRDVPNKVDVFTPASLAKHFSLPVQNFHQRNAKAPIMFHQAGLREPIAYQLRGTLFWPTNKQIIRGLPRVLAASDYVSDPNAMANEAAMFEALKSQDAIIEVADPGVTIRIYHRSGTLFYATAAAYDGGNPVTAAGIDNARALGIDYASQARRILETSYKNAGSLARLGYVPVFSLQLPERETIVPVERPDLILLDVIDSEFYFVDRLEKERIAEDYGLRVSTLHGRMQAAATPSEFYSRLRGLEHIAARDDVAGFVVKAPWNHDQLAVEVQPPTIRQAWAVVDEADLQSVYDAISTDFGAATDKPLPSPIDDKAFVAEMMLDYLDDHSRSVRWQVNAWVERPTDLPRG